jgi:hypothetical protein
VNYSENKNRLPYSIGEERIDIKDTFFHEGRVYRLKNKLAIEIDPKNVRIIIDLEEQA